MTNASERITNIYDAATSVGNIGDAADFLAEAVAQFHYCEGLCCIDTAGAKGADRHPDKGLSTLLGWLSEKCTSLEQGITEFADDQRERHEQGGSAEDAYPKISPKRREKEKAESDAVPETPASPQPNRAVNG